MIGLSPGSVVPDQTRVRLLKLRDISPPPALARELIRLAGDDEAEIRDVVRVVERSPEMTSRILHWANSAYYGERSKISSVKDGIIRVLGLSTAKSLLLVVSLSNNLDVQKHTFCPLERHWYLAVSTAAIAQTLAPSLMAPGKLSQGVVYTAGLIHNLGMLGLVHVFPAELKTIFSGDRSVPLNLRVEQCLGISPLLAGGWLGKRWGLPEDLIDTLNYHDDPAYQGENWPLVRLVGLSSKIAECNYDGKNISAVSSEYPFEALVTFSDISSAIQHLEERLIELKNFAQLLM